MSDIGIGKSTRIVQKASGGIMSALERARGSLASIPLGEKRLDPRTQKKRDAAEKTDPLVDTTLTRILYEMRNPQQPPDNTGGQ